MPEDDYDGSVYDPEALEAAERAVRDLEPDERPAGDQTSDAPIDEGWVKVATAASGDLARSLNVAYETLREAGIDVGFDPYRPGTVSSPFGMEARPISIVVPQSLEERARTILREADAELGAELEPLPREPREPRPSYEHADNAHLLEVRGRGASWRAVAIVVAILLALALFIFWRGLGA